jgi:hypothetical protein
MSEPQFPELQVLSPSDLSEVLAFSRLQSDPTNPFAEWSAPWRTESLTHYLSIGWSMARRDSRSGRLLGYALAQPVLFVRGQTQTVWIEHVCADSPELVEELVQAMVRVAKDKHMQRVLYNRADGETVEFKTTKG